MKGLLVGTSGGAFIQVITLLFINAKLVDELFLAWPILIWVITASFFMGGIYLRAQLGTIAMASHIPAFTICFVYSMHLQNESGVLQCLAMTTAATIGCMSGYARAHGTAKKILKP